MLYIYATTEKYEAAIDRLGEGVLINAETGEWYDELCERWIRRYDPAGTCSIVEYVRD